MGARKRGQFGMSQAGLTEQLKKAGMLCSGEMTCIDAEQVHDEIPGDISITSPSTRTEIII